MVIRQMEQLQKLFKLQIIFFFHAYDKCNIEKLDRILNHIHICIFIQNKQVFIVFTIHHISC